MSDHTDVPDRDEVTARQDLPAGGFSTWLRRTRRVQREKGSADVPCGGCIGCCTSAYFIHIAPGESETLSRIPKELLFPAPGLPKGNVVMGYDEKGRCPMLVDGRCSIYEHRPQTCHSYDCRVFSAAGIEAGDKGKELIDQRVRRWRFSHHDECDRKEHGAVRAAAKFMREHADRFPDGVVPGNPAQLAVLAIKVYDVFVDHADAPDSPGRARTDPAIAEAVIESLRHFDIGRAV